VCEGGWWCVLEGRSECPPCSRSTQKRVPSGWKFSESLSTRRNTSVWVGGGSAILACMRRLSEREGG
jgi:hypothetical protein